MSDEALRDVYARIMRQRDATGRASSVSIEEMQAVLERRGSEDDRVRTLDAIMRDHETRADFEILRAAYETAPARTASFPIPYAIAAALVLMVGSGLWLRSRSPEPDVMRGRVPEVSIAAPGLTAPAGAPLRFVWHPRSDATLYSLQLVDTDGNLAYTTLTPDTAVALPDSVRLGPDKEYRWWVEANRATEGTVKSQVRSLRIVAR